MAESGLLNGENWPTQDVQKNVRTPKNGLLYFTSYSCFTIGLKSTTIEVSESELMMKILMRL